MASVVSAPTHPVVFTTQSPYALPSQKFMIPASWKRYQLSQLINKALSLANPIPFDFLVRGELLRQSLGEWCLENAVGEEETLEVEYIQSILPPQRISELPHDDWVSSVSCDLPGHFLTASYDGHVRTFDYSQKVVHSFRAHQAPITSLCVLPSNGDGGYTIATSSHDLSAQLTRLKVVDDVNMPITTESVASLHLHTAPLSSISSNSTGTRLLTSSWDSLIGVFDTSIPNSDEVPLDQVEADRKKRRKVDSAANKIRGKRKAPLVAMKSHSGRVSKALFSSETEATSCGFDSTVRAWDVESGICTNTITSPEKPFLDMASISSNTILAASTDRTVTQFDIRASSATGISLPHSATPSCITVCPTANADGTTPIATGAYDGVVRVWDLRSTKSAVTSFRAWEEETKKVLSINWGKGMIGVGGEGGLSVWRIGEGSR